MSKTSFRRMLCKTPMRDLVRGRITGRLDIDRLLEASGLSGDAASKVRGVVKRTRLWRLEKVDVANELIAHFLDGIEADTPIHELIESFGDERQTAKLIRLAKKRQRPMIWHVFAWTRLSFAGFFGVYFVAALYLMTGSPSVTTDYLAKLNHKAAGVPTDEAAWPMYREALYEMGYIARVDYKSEKMDSSIRPDDEDWSEMLTFLSEHAESLAKVREAAAMPLLGYLVGFDTVPEDEIIFEPRDLSLYTYMGPHPPLFQTLLPHLGPMRNLTRLMAADTSRAIEAGDAEVAYSNIIAMLGLACHADEHPLLISGLVRMSLQNYAYRSAQEVMIARPDLWSDDQLRNLAHRIAAIEMTPDDWFNGERFWFYDYLQRTYTDDGHGGGQITSRGADATAMYSDGIMSSPPTTSRSAVIAASLPVAAALLAPRDDMRRVYDSLMDQSILESHRSLWADDGLETVEDVILKMNESFRTRIRYAPILIFMPAMSAVNRNIHTQEGYRDGVLVGIALELYKRQHGDWPGELDELVPGYLPSVPVDRLTGNPVRYRVTGDGPVVYSVGVDGDDDGGRPPVDLTDEPKNAKASPKQSNKENTAEEEHDGDWVLWPVPWED
jgi:hypothetical protein